MIPMGLKTSGVLGLRTKTAYIDKREEARSSRASAKEQSEAVWNANAGDRRWTGT